MQKRKNRESVLIMVAVLAVVFCLAEVHPAIGQKVQVETFTKDTDGAGAGGQPG